jgi:putative aminopeptidase FrvX
MDAIGLMVTGIVEGFLRITQVGGIDARILPAKWSSCTDSGTCGDGGDAARLSASA